jgi:hypothetical protein
MMPKCELFKSTPLHVQKLNYKKGIYELDDHVGEKALRSCLRLKFRPTKKTPPTSFPNCLLESHVWVKSMFLYAMLPHHEKANRNTIWVTRRTNAKLPHHRGIVLGHPMENEMPFTHHAIKQ